MILKSQRALREAIHKKKLELSDADLFMSTSYKEFADAMISGVTKHYNQPVKINFRVADENESAFTDGVTIDVNIENKGLKRFSRADKHRAIVATILHECSHIIFTDFKLSKAVSEKLCNENILFPQPDASPEMDHLNMWLLQNNGGKKLSSLYHYLDNCIEDGYVDRRIVEYIPGYGQDRIWYKKKLAEDIPSYEEMLGQGLDNVTILLNMILSYAKFNVLKYEDIHAQDRIIKLFYDVKLMTDDAIRENNSVMRKACLNNIFAHMFSLIEEEINRQKKDPEKNADHSSENGEKSKPGENQSQNNGDPSQNAQNGQNGDGNGNMQNNGIDGNNGQNEASKSCSIEQISNAIEHAVNNLSNATKSCMDNHHNTQKLNSKGTQEANHSPASVEEQKKEDPVSSNAVSLQLEQLENDAANEKIAALQEEEIQKELSKELGKIPEKGSVHYQVDSYMERAVINSQSIKTYEDLHANLDAIARRLAKNLEKEIRERKLGDTLNGLYMGKRLDNKGLYRQDKKVFTKKIQPENIPDMEVSLLVDLSGSMNGERLNQAMQAAYVLYEFCFFLHIPVSVFGHHTEGRKVKMHCFASSDSLDQNDPVRIFGMNASGCNRDGYALRFCLNQLDKSEAATRLQIIISDGHPNHGDYNNEKGKEDIQDAVSKAKKKGITTITAAIGSDTESVRYVYKDGIADKKSAIFLDITELERLPKLLPAIIKKYLY